MPGLSTWDTKYTLIVMGQITTIKLSKETKKDLARIGTKEDTYEDIIKRLINFYRRNTKHS